MTGRMDFGFTFGTPGAGLSAASRREGPFRIVVLGDFSGHGLRATSPPKSLAQRAATRVDVDNLDAVFKRLAPAVSIEALGARIELAFGGFDDFHPDHLSGALPTPALPATTVSPTLPSPAMASEGDAATMERLLGRKPEPAKPSGIDALIKSIVTPSLLPEAPAEMLQAKVAADAAKADQLRAVLHHPAFQALEARWLGVQHVVRQLDLDGDLQLYLLDVSQAELQADSDAAQASGRQSDLAQALQRLAQAEELAPSLPLLVGLYDFGPSVVDLALLSSLGAVARQWQGAFMASALPSVLGLPSFGGGSDATLWPGMSPDAQARWDAFRRSPQAAAVHLAGPRVLMRLPYGRATDPAGAFEEMAPGFAHDACLWGSGALACAQLIGQSFLDQGWDLRVGELNDLEDLPAYVLEIDGEKRLLPCAEANLGETAGQRLLALGLMPLLSYKQRNAVRVMGFQAMG